MLHKYSTSEKGFTLVEVLIVVALIAILAVIALVTINPFEAQKRTRDARRLKEIGTMQGIIEQYIADNPDASAASAVSTDNASAVDCGTTGWHGLALCNYANTIAVDPLNREAEFAVTDGTVTTGSVYYYYEIDSNLRYTICSRMESAANSGKLLEDGITDNWFSVYSSKEATAPTCP